jgi:hypothetical protein
VLVTTKAKVVNLTLADTAVKIVATGGANRLEVLVASSSLAGEPWPSEVNGK